MRLNTVLVVADFATRRLKRWNPLDEHTPMVCQIEGSPASQAMQIHLHHNGSNIGIFSLEQVQEMIRSGVINYKTLAWSEGRTECRPVVEITGATIPPAAPKEVQSVHPVLRYILPSGRIGRRMWLLRSFANAVGFMLLAFVSAFMPQDAGTFYVAVLWLIWVFVSLTTSAKRFHDLNLTGWGALLVVIPLFPILLLILKGTDGPNRYRAAKFACKRFLVAKR